MPRGGLAGNNTNAAIACKQHGKEQKNRGKRPVGSPVVAAYRVGGVRAACVPCGVAVMVGAG